jgi:hydroxyacylglutathione hydrolase
MADTVAFRLETIVSAPFEENTYVAHWPARTDCIVVDPGFAPQKIIAYLQRAALTPAAILNTHGHADHIAGNAALKQRWPECPLVIGAGEAHLLTDAVANLSQPFGFPVTSPAADQLVHEGETYAAAGFELQVYEIPGHSPGHVVFVCRQSQPFVVFGGDVLFAGGIGRFDFPGGSLAMLRDGIHRKLFTLPDDTIVLPGHGPPTTVGQERRSNPFL